MDKDLINLISGEVNNLEKELENIKSTSTVEAKKISDALLTIRDEIDNFDKRISDIMRTMEEQRKEQLEKEEELSGAIEDISSDLTKLGKRQDVSEVNISMLEKREGDLETTVSSIKDEQCSLNSKVGALKIEQARLDSRVRALEGGTLKASPPTKIAQVPSRNLCFCGRDSQLEAIAAQLRNTGNGCVHSAICGLGGVGKTSLAVEFLCRHEEEYPGGIFWISGENTNNFQGSLGELAHQIGTLENDFSNTLSRTIDWLTKQEELWCLVVDNLDELEMPTGMKKLLTGHWKHTACGHIIITTRREVVEIEEEMGISDQCCIALKCLTEDEGIQFLQMRIGKASDEESDVRQLVHELGGLPLALDQAGAYMKFVNESPKKYVRKYKKKRLALLKRKKARHLVENTSADRLAVHTTWLLNFDHISHFSNDMDLGGAPTLVMQVCAFFGPDDIPYELINDGLNKEDSSTGDSDLWDQAEIVSLLTKFSLFQRYGTNSFSVHRLVQEVIRSHLEKEIKLKVLSCAVHILHFALVRTRSPAAVCEWFVEDAVFSVENPPSLHLWGKLASHATYLQEHLHNFLMEHNESVHALLHSEETMRVFNEAGIFFSVSQEKVKAQEMQQLKLDILVNLEKSTIEDGNKLPNYFIDIPLKDRDYKLISHCMRHPAEHDAEEEAHLSQKRREDDANQLREQGNRAVRNKNFDMALNLYSSAIDLLVADYRLFSNRALCYLKLGRPQEALNDCERCLALNPNYSKALQREAWALQELIKNGLTQRIGQKKAALAMAVHFDPTLLDDHTFCEMFPEAGALTITEVNNASQLAFALMTAQANETLLLHEGEYNLNQFVAHTDLQIVGLGQGIILTFKEVFSIFSSRCYFENMVLPKGSVGLVCQGKDAGVHMNHCEISGGYSSCEDYPECNGGPGCIAASLGKPVCDRTSKFGDSESRSGVVGFPGVQILSCSALIEYCAVCDCGGGGTLVVGDGSHLEVRGCEVYRNHQAGLEAREGGNLVASDNRIFNGGYHGILIGPNAGECIVNDNKIFENAREGIFALSNKNKIAICNNDIHHNKPFGISLDDDSRLLISDNRIFENGFWGILAKSRTSANITRNIISGNKCGGIFIGVNYSGRVHLESNVVRDHSGPWLEYQSDSLPVDSSLLDSESFGQICSLPPGENRYYSNPPVLHQNKQFNNEEGMYHPREVAGRVYSGCTFCRRSKDEVQCLVKCPICNIASYCCKDCRSKHWPTHKTLCIALKSRYSVTVKTLPLVEPGKLPMRTFGAHLKGIGTGPKPKHTSHQKFIVKIQTRTLNCHPLQLLVVYDKSLTVDCFIQSPEIFSIIMECGVLGALNKFTSKKVFFWAMYAEKGEKLSIFLDQLAPYQEW